MIGAISQSGSASFAFFESVLRFSVVCDLTRPQAADLKDMSQKHPLIPIDVDAEELIYSAQHCASPCQAANSETES